MIDLKKRVNKQLPVSGLKWLHVLFSHVLETALEDDKSCVDAWTFGWGTRFLGHIPLLRL